MTQGPQQPPAALASPQAGAIVADLFRRTSARLVARIARRLSANGGGSRLDLAEDAVQHALLQALRQWPFHGVPSVPEAWLARAAWNRAIDLLRADMRAGRLAGMLAPAGDEALHAEFEAPPDPQAIDDDELRLLFACCHPDIPPEAAIALALRTLCGFGIVEVARAFLVDVPAMQQRLVRAKRLIARQRLAFELPEGAALGPRRSRVLHTLYLLFNEGYAASTGGELLRPALCAEAIRLCEACAAHPHVGSPEVDALLALMLLQASRLDARVQLRPDAAVDEPTVALVPLRHQDRTRWSRPLIARGHRLLARAQRGDALTRYHVQAGIAGLHASAATWDATDWAGVCSGYDLLLAIDDTPVVRLNRAIALGERDGPQAGLAALTGCLLLPALRANAALHGAIGECHARLGANHDAEAAFARAAACARTVPERRHFEVRRAHCRRLEAPNA